MLVTIDDNGTSASHTEGGLQTKQRNLAPQIRQWILFWYIYEAGFWQHSQGIEEYSSTFVEGSPPDIKQQTCT